MKIIHCADLHLDSSMSTHLSEEKRRLRRAELLHTFERMISYAEENRVSAILIAGDMFDKRRISAQTKNVVLRAFAEHPSIHFYYLKGNHDRDNFLDELEELPENLFVFHDSWTGYEEAGGRVVIMGRELSGTDALDTPPVLDSGRCNIVLLHGQETEGGNDGECVDLRKLRNRGIDYLALGHIHSFRLEKLDGRGVYCYPGCLEARGFDECGPHGFVLLEIAEEEGKVTSEFIPFAQRSAVTVETDVTGCEDSAQILQAVRARLLDAAPDRESMVKLVLTGTLGADSEYHLPYIEAAFTGEYFFVKVSDETRISVDRSRYLNDNSLRGEFVRLVMQNGELTEDEKNEIVRLGLTALDGEEV